MGSARASSNLVGVGISAFFVADKAVEAVHGRTAKKVIRSRFVRVILAQGPC
jgi:hypothetical protein